MFFLKKNEPRGERLSGTNLTSYLANTYGSVGSQTKRYIIPKFTPILQQEYGGANDCTLCSITAIAAYLENYARSFFDLYARVETAAHKYHYDPNEMGTFPTYINNIIDDTFGVKSKKKYGKTIGYTWNAICEQINAHNPVILSVHNDGRNYYVNHSIVVVGYMEYSTGAKLLCVYDNWTKTISYVDYKKLPLISCINYFVDYHG